MKLARGISTRLVIGFVMPLFGCDSDQMETYPDFTAATYPPAYTTTATMPQGQAPAAYEAAVFCNGTDGIDIDITTLSSTMVYTVVYCMVSEPYDYVGMTVKMSGQFSHYYDEITDTDYYACIIQDATACCAQGIEFELADDEGYTYPEEGEEICVIGTFDIYHQQGFTYCTLRDAEVCEE